jgi:hypothetical protein
MVTTHAFRTKPLCLEVINGWLLKQTFATYRPDGRGVTHRPVRAWTVLEVISDNFPVPARWIGTNGGYTLIADSPFGRTSYIWAASGMCFGALIVGGYYWRSRKKTGFTPALNHGAGADVRLKTGHPATIAL